GWPAGAYFFVRDGDARSCVIHCIDHFLGVYQGSSACEGEGVPEGLMIPPTEAAIAWPAKPPWVADPVPGPREGTPEWDDRRRILSYSGVICRRYRRHAVRQFQLLDAFERSGWLEVIDDPIGCDFTLRQAISDLNDGLETGSPIRFRAIGQRPNWYVRSDCPISP